MKAIKHLYVISQRAPILDRVFPAGQLHGFEVVSSASLEQAAREFTTREPAVVIVDQELPSLDDVQHFCTLCSLEYCTPLIWIEEENSSPKPELSNNTSHNATSLQQIETKIAALQHSLFQLNRQDFVDALANERFILYCQPSVCMTSQQIVGAEVLLRWQHPKYGLIGPIQFLPLAAACDMADQVYDWILRAFFTQIASWKPAQRMIKFGLNLAEEQIADSQLTCKLTALCDEFNLPSRHLMLEINEQTAQQLRYQNNIQQLSEHGWMLILDRFALDTMSLEQLYGSPYQYVKIHPKYISRLGQDKKAEIITKALIHTCHDFGLKTIAVGIENATAWHDISAFGCKFAQGFYITQPIPLNAFKNWFIGTS